MSGKGFVDLGGLVGYNKFEGKITTSYATGGVSGQGDNFGGLAGVNSGVIAASYATGRRVRQRLMPTLAALLGTIAYTGVITAAYAEGSVSGRADRYGGLLGSNQGVITFCFSTGGVPQRGGGLIGSNGIYGTVASCYWDTETSGQCDSAGGGGKTTAELRSPTGYTLAPTLTGTRTWTVTDQMTTRGCSARRPIVSRSQLGDSRHRSRQSERQAPTRIQVEHGIVLSGKLTDRLKR